MADWKSLSASIPTDPKDFDGYLNARVAIRAAYDSVASHRQGANVTPEGAILSSVAGLLDHDGSMDSRARMRAYLGGLASLQAPEPEAPEPEAPKPEAPKPEAPQHKVPRRREAVSE